MGRSEVTKKEWIEAVNLLSWELAATAVNCLVCCLSFLQ